MTKLAMPKCPKHTDVTLICPACLGEQYGSEGARQTNRRMTKAQKIARARKGAQARWKAYRQQPRSTGV